MWDGVEKRVSQRRVEQRRHQVNGYDEQEVIAFQQIVMATYKEANQPLDLSNVVWAARMIYDAVTVGYLVSQNKHLAELRAALGLK
jgi:hypothetical protein